MSKWKIDPFIPFHFTILKEFYKIHASPVTLSLFHPMIKLIYGPFLRKGDGLIQSIFHFPISSHFGAILHHSIHLSVFLSSYMNKKLTHIFGHTFCGCSSPCLLYHLQCQKVCFTLFTPLDHFLLPLSIQFLRQHKEVRRLRRCLRCARLASGLYVISSCCGKMIVGMRHLEFIAYNESVSIGVSIWSFIPILYTLIQFQ